MPNNKQILRTCASTYYFPNGPPNRPYRQVSIPDPSDNDTLIPEPKQLIPFPPPNDSYTKGAGILTFDIPPVTSPDQPKYRDLEQKPESRPFQGIQMAPKRKEHTMFLRQSNSCRQSYSFGQSGESIQLDSPNYPRDYPNNMDSSICFSSPSGTTMRVSCSDFNLEYAQGCAYDYFGIGYGGSPSSIQKYCGSGTLNSPASSANSLAIVFKTDSSNPGAANREAYRFRCRITVSESAAPSPPPSPPGAGGDCSCGKRNDGSRIVGGTNAKVNEFPWRCFLRTREYSFFCGCAIISNKWVLTAAHCTDGMSGISVVIGDHDRSTTTEAASQTIAVDKIVQHKNYDDNTMDNDVSLLRLSRSITYSNSISPICLPFNYVNDDFNGTRVTTSGWGDLKENGTGSIILQKVDLPVLTTAQCARYLPGQINENMICTYEPGQDTCQGDSGGSIDLNRNGNYYHIGVVSWGIGCGRRNRPGVYAKTTKYIDWIRQNSEGETFCQA